MKKRIVAGLISLMGFHVLAGSAVDYSVGDVIFEGDIEKAGPDAQLICYAGAPHGWTVFDSPRYAEKQDCESWDLFIQYLEDVLK